MLNPFQVVKSLFFLIVLIAAFGSGFWSGVQSERNFVTRQITNVVIPRK